MDYFDYIVLTVAAVVSYRQGLGIKFSRISNRGICKFIMRLKFSGSINYSLNPIHI